MLLYLVYDKDQKTLSTPMLAPTLAVAQNALQELNPENLNSLIIHPLTELNSPLDLLLLKIDDTIPFPDFLIGEAKEAFANPTTEGRESLTSDL